MYIAIDNDNHSIIGAHSDVKVLADLAHLWDCSADADIQIFPTDEPLHFNDLSEDCLKDLLVGEGLAVAPERYTNLKSLQVYASELPENVVNPYLLEMQAEKRVADGERYVYNSEGTTANLFTK